jgi:hypothetical protein
VLAGMLMLTGVWLASVALTVVDTDNHSFALITINTADVTLKSTTVHCNAQNELLPRVSRLDR